MNKTSLSALYRRLTSATPAPLALDADDLASAADGTLNAERRDHVAEALAGSALQADVVHMLGDLKTESEALAANVARTQRETTHRRNQRGERRIAAGRRFGNVTRWATAMAACLVAVLGIWTLRHPALHAPTRDHATVKADEIFNSRDTISHFGMESTAQVQHKARVEGDHLFHSDFNGG
jgi:hypothetical protein